MFTQLLSSIHVTVGCLFTRGSQPAWWLAPNHQLAKGSQ